VALRAAAHAQIQMRAGRHGKVAGADAVESRFFKLAQLTADLGVLRVTTDPGYSLNNMRFVAAGRGTRISWVSVLGMVCVALVLMTGVLQVTHSHPSGQPDHDCSLCLTAHHVAQAVVVVTLAVPSRQVARFVPESFTPVPRQRFVLKLAIRPPPVPPAFA
jgi:hypothetical protein